jgi:SAM-dependent methyltransferase
MADSGVAVAAVEPSPAMLAVFEEKLADCPHLADRIDCHEADAESFDLDRRFPLAIMSGTFDHLLDRDARLVALRNVARHLEPGGTLVFDVFVGLMDDQPRSPAGRIVEDGTEYRRFVEREVRDDDTVAVTLTYEAYEDGERVGRIVQPSRTGIVDREGVHDCLDVVGFEVGREFGDYDRTPWEDDDLLIVAARYQGNASTGGAE